jgi:hypothetical protein
LRHPFGAMSAGKWGLADQNSLKEVSP